MNTLAKNIKKLRKNANMSQINFARYLHTTQQRVSEWECGKAEPSLYYIIKIIKVLGTDFESLTAGIMQ